MHESGELVRQYRIIRPIGRGGMGEVYEAEDETLRRRVALKTIRAADRPTAREKSRFLREARILSQLDHPGICRIHDYIEGADRDHLVLEFIKGRTLTDLDYPAHNRLDLIAQLLQVMAVAHENGIIHRDLKPDNVMVTGDGQLKVLDFGLARPESLARTRPGAASTVDENLDAAATLDATFTLDAGILGTPAFMSPEQAAGEAATPASDMYSCGLVIRFLLTGTTAYGKTTNVVELLERVRKADVEPLAGIDPDLAAIVDRLTHPSPGGRLSADSALVRLGRYLAKPAQRKRRVALAALLLLAALGGAKYTADLRFERGRAEIQRAKAEDLLGFMLGDLRLKLDEVGRLDIMDGVGDQALAYFGDRDPSDMAGDEATRYVRTLNLIGGIRLDRGEPDSAAVAFAEALNVARRDVTNARDDLSARALLGETEFWLGNAVLNAGDPDSSLTHFRAYHDLAHDLVRREPDNPAWRQEVAYAQTTLAQVHLFLEDRAAALVMLGEALDTKRALLAADPDNEDLKSSLANTEAVVAMVMWRSLRLRESFEHYRRARRLAEEALAADPDDSELQSRCATLLQKEATAALAVGDLDDAANCSARDLKLSYRLRDRDPENFLWRTGLGHSLATAGRVALYAGRRDEADRLWHEWRKLWPHAPGHEDAESWFAWASGSNAFAAVAIDAGRPADARRILDRCLGSLPPAGLSRDEVQIRDQATVLAMVLARMAGRTEEVLALGRGIETPDTLMVDRISRGGALAVERHRACLLGEVDPERRLAARMQEIGFADLAHDWILARVGKTED